MSDGVGGAVVEPETSDLPTEALCPKCLENVTTAPYRPSARKLTMSNALRLQLLSWIPNICNDFLWSG